MSSKVSGMPAPIDWNKSNRDAPDMLMSAIQGTPWTAPALLRIGLTDPSRMSVKSQSAGVLFGSLM